jgi:hypothetical protein
MVVDAASSFVKNKIAGAGKRKPGRPKKPTTPKKPKAKKQLRKHLKRHLKNQPLNVDVL